MPTGSFRRSFCKAALVAMVAVSLLAGCGASSGGDVVDPTVAAVRAAESRLIGDWRPVSFVPETPLGPTLQAMLEYQYQTLVVHFDGHRIQAESRGVHFDRKYEVREANGDRFKLISYDEGGIPYESMCEFGPNDTLVIYSQTSPWRGVGTMKRTTAP